MKNKKIWIPVFIMIPAVASIFLYLNKDFIKYMDNDYNIDGHFADTSDADIFKFIFVSLEKNDPGFVNYISNDIKKEFTDQKIENKRNIIIIHYYCLSDTVQLNEKLLTQLQKQYPKKKALKDRLRYIGNAFISTHMASGNNYSDSVFSSPVIIPKPGIKAKDIFK